jgi:hypothetical protein
VYKTAKTNATAMKKGKALSLYGIVLTDNIGWFFGCVLLLPSFYASDTGVESRSAWS